MKISIILLSLLLCVHIAFAIGSFLRAQIKPTVSSFTLAFIIVPISLLIGCMAFLIRMIDKMKGYNFTLFQRITFINIVLIVYFRAIPEIAEGMAKILALYKISVQKEKIKWSKH